MSITINNHVVETVQVGQIVRRRESLVEGVESGVAIGVIIAVFAYDHFNIAYAGTAKCTEIRVADDTLEVKWSWEGKEKWRPILRKVCPALKDGQLWLTRGGEVVEVYVLEGREHGKVTYGAKNVVNGEDISFWYHSHHGASACHTPGVWLLGAQPNLELIKLIGHRV